MMQTIAIDFETYYHATEYSVAKMNPWMYAMDNRFHAYMVAVVRRNDAGELVRWVGDPKDFDWSTIHNCRWISHNCAFEAVVIARLRRDGVIPPTVVCAETFDTADLAAYLRAPRNLKGAAKWLMDITHEKRMRTDMNGLSADEAKAKGMWEALCQYCGDDSELCFLLWERFHEKWPAVQQLVSRESLKRCLRGIYVDVPKVDAAIAHLTKLVQEALSLLPWASQVRADGTPVPPTSPKAIRLQGRQDGLELPASLAQDDPEMMAFEDKYADKYPWINAVRTYRRAGNFLKKVQSLKAGIREDSTMMLQLKYHGAHTGRFSGGWGDKDGGRNEQSGGKFNMLNLPRGEMFGVDMRSMFIARPGHTFLIADFAQIEARLLQWHVGSDEIVRLILEEGNIYQAYAKAKGKYNGKSLKKDNPQLYQLIKASVLSLGYGAGAEKYQFMAKSQYGLDRTMEEATAEVAEFRADNPKIKAYWDAHNQGLRMSAIKCDPIHQIVLPSGRSLWYYEPRIENHGKKWKDGREKLEVMVCDTMDNRKDNRFGIYGGLATENTIQAMGYDVLCDAWAEIIACKNEFDWNITLDVYDELVIEVPIEKKEDAKVKLAYCMQASTRTWAKGCPIDSEIVESPFYCK